MYLFDFTTGQGCWVQEFTVFGYFLCSSLISVLHNRSDMDVGYHKDFNVLPIPGCLVSKLFFVY